MGQSKIEKVIGRISVIRLKNGYTLENMASELDITPAAYRKLEMGETKLTLERLFSIAEILKTSLTDLLGIGNDVFQQTNSENATGYQQSIENYYQENKSIYEKLLESKEEQISLLKTIIEDLKK